MTHIQSTDSGVIRQASRIVLAAFTLTLWPQEVLASTAQDVAQVLPGILPQRPVRPGNKKLPTITPALPAFQFSNPPTDLEISRARVFEEPLIPSAPTGDAENAGIAQALLAFADDHKTSDALLRARPLAEFLEANPSSAWRTALATNLALMARRTGHFSKALEYGALAWKEGRGSTAPSIRALAARGLMAQAELWARLGRLSDLKPLLEEVANEDFQGPSAGKLSEIRDSVWLMENRPEDSFRCGPLAVGAILAESMNREDEKVEAAKSTDRGTSLLQMRDLAKSTGLQLKMAYRQTPEGVVPTPALVHWKVGHFAALVRREGQRYLLQDPTFGDEIWISQEALNAESDGFFLIPAGKMPVRGWRSMTDSEGSAVWGKGAPPSKDTKAGNKKKAPKKGPCEPASGPNKGMCGYAFQELLATLTLWDTPLSYSSPKGPPVYFEPTYNQFDPFQPAVFTYSNIGPNWALNLIGYVQDDPSNAAQTVDIYEQGGGVETYSGYNAGTQTYTVHYDSRDILKRVTTPSFRYERSLSDGSLEIYSQVDGALTAGRKVFLTETRDAAGNSRKYVYDSTLRIVAIVDALGQVSTLSYELGSDPLKITRVTDPFGRFATLSYDSLGRLAGITDTLGLSSEFTYGASNFISALKTPYGTTTFTTQQVGANAWVESTDPLGGQERIEYVNGHDPAKNPASDPAGVVPTGFSTFNSRMDTGMTFFWGKRLMQEAPRDYATAELTHWAWLPGTHQTTAVARARKMPKENRVWLVYEGQSGPTIGSSTRPIKVGRVLDSGASQIWEYAYNQSGYMINAKDPLGRETRYTYGTGSTPDADQANCFGIDLLKVEQKNGAAYEKLASYVYDASHNLLTSTDASNQSTTYTYNAQGQVLTVTTPPRAGITESRTTTMIYDAATGYLTGVQGVAPADTAAYTYDGLGRLRTSTDADGYVMTFDYDAMDRSVKTTFPDSTTEETVYEKLHVARTKDRRGRWTSLTTNVLRQTTSVRDPLGRTVTFDWCGCGSLNALVDGKGQRTAWEYDIQGRPTKMIRPDNSFASYVYENTTSRLKEANDPRSQKATVTYFNDNRWSSVAYTNLAAGVAATPTVSFTYDPVYPRLLTMVDGTGTTTYAYNPIPVSPGLGAGRLASVDGPLTNDVISYSYDELGRVKQRQINGAASTQTTTYDVLGRVDGETNALGAFTYGYDGVTGRLLTMNYPNGNVSSFAYFGNTDDHRLQTIHHKKTGAITISKYDYTYDKEGVIQTWQIQKDAAAPQVFNLGHDLADQLVEATLQSTDPTPVVAKRYRYAYDKAENRTTEQIDGAVTQASHNVLNQLTGSTPGGAIQFAGTTSEAANVTVGVVGQTATAAQTTATNEFKAQVTVPSGTTNVEVKATDPNGNLRTNTYSVSQSGASQTFTYDGNGNMLSDGTRTYEWDAINQLVAINQGVNRSEFIYDGWGKRVRMVEKVSGSTTSDRRFLWCGMEICEERDSLGGTVIKRFFSQGVVDSGTSLYYATDHLGSARELTDGTGAIRARYDYDPYGRTTKVSGDKDSDYQYAGLFAHPASGLQLAVFRAYDPGLGRWINEDPIGLRGGLNANAYVAGRPDRSRDPEGLVLPLAAPAVALALDALANALVATLAILTAAAAAEQATEYISKNNVDKPDYSDSYPPPNDPQIIDIDGHPDRYGPPNETVRGPDRTRRYDPDGLPDVDVDVNKDGSVDVAEWTRIPKRYPRRAPDEEQRPWRPGDPPPPRKASGAGKTSKPSGKNGKSGC